MFKLSRTQVVLLLIVCLAVITIILAPRFISSTPEEAVPLQDATGMVHAIAIDHDADSQIDIASIQRGDDVLLAVKPDAKVLQKESKIQGAKIYLFNDLESLLKHDKNLDGRIGPEDPIFNDLMVLTLRSADPEPYLQPIEKSGVRVLVFEKRYLLLVQQGQQLPIGSTIGYAIMTDSSRRALKLVMLPLGLFK